MGKVKKADLCPRQLPLCKAVHTQYIMEEIEMKSTGVVRKIDELGRVVLPISIRHNLDINERDSLEIFTDGDRIILQKYQPACIFCNNVDDVVFYNGKRICVECLEKIKTQF